MPAYQTHIRVHVIGGRPYRIRALTDVQQFDDPDLHAQRAGICSSQWSLFGQVWPSGRLLAEAMASYDVTGKRILELGCGLGLASLVLRARGADIVASDRHPLAEVFLAYNAALNDLDAVQYRTLDWDAPADSLGRFDLVIGSDVLYERRHVAQLSALLQRHAQPVAEVLVADPGRGNSGAFTRAMLAQGYLATEQRAKVPGAAPARGRLLGYCRPAAMTVEAA